MNQLLGSQPQSLGIHSVKFYMMPKIEKYASPNSKGLEKSHLS